MVTISRAEANALKAKEAAGWVDGMYSYCSLTLTVKDVVPDGREAHIYVEENSYWWKDSFISEIIYCQEELCPISAESLDSLLFGGA